MTIRKHLQLTPTILINMPGGEYMAELATVLNLINYIFVLIFGIVVSFYFADIPWEDNK